MYNASILTFAIDSQANLVTSARIVKKIYAALYSAGAKAIAQSAFVTPDFLKRAVVYRNMQAISTTGPIFPAYEAKRSTHQHRIGPSVRDE